MVNWGIVGLGNIADKFAQDLKIAQGGQLIAVASRDASKAKDFADLYNCKFAFGDYLDLFRCTEVEAVYIATPHSFHARQSIEAMEHGKHVLCEKPMGVNRAEVEKMIEAARKHNVFLMEALWSCFNPTIQQVKQLIDTGELGRISYLQADFAFYSLDRDEKGRLLNPELAGGSILDIGIYPVFLAYHYLGKPEHLLATSNFHHTGVEVQTSIIFSYQSAQAILYSGLDSNTEIRAEIAGTKGTVRLHPKWHKTEGYSVFSGNQSEDHSLPLRGLGYVYEIEEVHQCLQYGQTQSQKWTLQNSLDLIGLLDDIRRQSDVVFPFETEEE